MDLSAPSILNYHNGWYKSAARRVFVGGILFERGFQYQIDGPTEHFWEKNTDCTDDQDET